MTLQLLSRTLLPVRFLCCFHLFNIVGLIFPICVVICNSVALAGACEFNIKHPPKKWYGLELQYTRDVFLCWHIIICYIAMRNGGSWARGWERVQFTMVSMRLEKPICAPPRFSDIFPSVAFETVPMCIWLTMALSRPFKEDRQVLILGASDVRQSIAWQLDRADAERTAPPPPPHLSSPSPLPQPPPPSHHTTHQLSRPPPEEMWTFVWLTGMHKTCGW